MLAKLLKYEFKATARIFLLLYAAVLAFALFNAGMIWLNDAMSTDSGESVMSTIYTIITTLSAILYALLVVAVFVGTIVIIIVRFYRMLGNEGYLWFTLPVTANQHLLSKLITAFVWVVAGTVTVIISVGLITLPTGWLSELHYVTDFWDIAVSLGFNPWMWIVCLVVLLVVSVIFSILNFFAAMAIGPRITKSRLGGTILAYLIIYVAVQVISTIQLLVISIPINDHAQTITNTLIDIDIPTMAMLGQLSASIDSIVVIFTVSYGLVNLSMAVGFYLLTRYFMTKKLNLA